MPQQIEKTMGNTMGDGDRKDVKQCARADPIQAQQRNTTHNKKPDTRTQHQKQMQESKREETKHRVQAAHD